LAAPKVGHSWGSDLAVRYALDHPDRVASVVGVAGHGLHKDRTWSQIYEASQHLEPDLEIVWEPAVHTALDASFVRWIHEPDLLRRLADSDVAMTFLAPQHDIRPSWPLQQLAAKGSGMSVERSASSKGLAGMIHQMNMATFTG
jgi:proline iminopeptidase